MENANHPDQSSGRVTMRILRGIYLHKHRGEEGDGMRTEKELKDESDSIRQTISKVGPGLRRDLLWARLFALDWALEGDEEEADP